MNATQKIHLATFERRHGEQLRLYGGRMRGKKFLDVRSWWQKPGSDEWLPSRRGVTIRESELGRLRMAITLCEEMPLRVDGDTITIDESE